MFIGIGLALIAGSFVSLQNIFNTKMNEHIGTWMTTAIVLGLGFFASLTIGLFFEGSQLFNVQEIEAWGWFSGILGVGIVSCLMQSIKLLGPTVAISLVLTSQLVFALLSDSQGWFGLEQIPLTLWQVAGVLLIICGIFVFKLAGTTGNAEERSKI